MEISTDIVEKNDYDLYFVDGLFSSDIIIKENNIYRSFKKNMMDISIKNLPKMDKLNAYYFSENDLKYISKAVDDVSYFRELKYNYIFYKNKNNDIVFLFEYYFLIDSSGHKENLTTPTEINKCLYEFSKLEEEAFINYNDLLPSIKKELESNFSKNIIKYLKETDNVENYHRLKRIFEPKIKNINLTEVVDDAFYFRFSESYFITKTSAIDLNEVRNITYYRKQIYLYFKNLEKYESFSCSIEEFQEILEYFTSFKKLSF